MSAQDLLEEVVADEPVASTEAPDEVVGVRAAGQRQRGEVERGRPALGTIDELDERVVRQRDALAGEHLPRLVHAEGEVLGPQLRQVVRDAQPPQSQAGVSTADDHEVRLCGEAPHEELDLVVTLGRLHEVEVVEDQHQVVRSAAASAVTIADNSARGCPLEVPWSTRTGSATGQHAARPLQSSGHVVPQPVGVVVAAVERDPGGGRQVRCLSHWATSVVLPYPAGAAIRVTGWRTARIMASTRRLRSIQLSRAGGGWSFASTRWPIDERGEGSWTDGSAPSRDPLDSTRTLRR